MKKSRIISVAALLISVVMTMTSCAGLSDLKDILNSSEVSEESQNESSENKSEEAKDESASSENSEKSENSDDSKDNSDDAEDVLNEVSKEEFEGASGESPIADLYDYCIDSCVSIVCTVEVTSQGIWGNPSTYETTSLGSGFIIEGGHIVTNHHVIDDAKEIKVVFSDGDEVKAEIVGSDETYDIAVLKVKTDKALTPVKLGDSSKIRIGEEVIAIGTPSGIEFAGTLTYGVVSGLNRKIEITDDYGKVLRTMYLIQTDATLNPGNSGGPLFNMKGEVVGVNNMKLISSYEGIGFSIPINGAMEIINALIKGEELPDSDYATTAAYLGIEGATVSAVREDYNLGKNVPDGVLVVSVERKSAIYKAGLSAYDVITKFEGVEVKSIEELKNELAKHNAGKEVTIEIYRASRSGDTGETLTLKFKLEKAN
ncbi:MAG: trypsin-like peptidase domain-containing protein [Clostridia bacterium]|nr:trypsin-like peptidase domain-containing protein [Clostridia bacterium]